MTHHRRAALGLIPAAAASLVVPALAQTAPAAAPAATRPPVDPEREKFENAMIAEQYAAASRAAVRLAEALARDPATQVFGNPDGDVTFVEFSDYQCSFCKAAEPRIRAAVAADGNVRWVLKEFPILGPSSITGTKVALASVAQGKYQAVHHALMDYRGQLTDERVFEIAAAAGVDVDRVKREMDAPAIANQIIANFNLARQLRIVVVPGFVFNGRVLAGVSAKTETAKIDFPTEFANARAARS
jgi:protein-disulfide isomerase